jgi:hypothetical protein
MTIIDFPSNPSINDTHIQNGIEWVWTGTTWDLVCETVMLPTSSYVGIDPIVVTSSIDGNNNVLVTISHTESGVTPGTYNSLTVDVYGHITSGSVVQTPTYGVGEILFGDENGIPTSSANIYYNTQSGVVQITGSVDITGGLTASLQEGYVWIGNSDGRNVQISTASILEPYTLLSDFNNYTESTDNRLDSIESKTGSYATTGSNIFEGNQTINGDLYVTGGFTVSLQEGYMWVGDENNVNIQVPTSSLFDQNNFVRVLTIPPTYIDFTQPIKPQIVNYINNIGTYDTLTHGHLIIEDTDSKWNIVIYYTPSNELSSTTEINIWFDNSGSMNSILPNLLAMVVSCLKEMLLPIYGDETTYNQRVKVRTFDGYSGVPTPYQSYITAGNIGDERTFAALNITGSSDSITNVINLVFQDEAGGQGYYTEPFNVNTNRTSNYTTDITNLRNTLSSIANTDYYKGVVYQISGSSDYSNFLEAVSSSTPPSYSAQYGLSDIIDNGSIKFEYNVIRNGSSNQYLSIVRDTLISFGYTNIGDIPTTPCTELLYGETSVQCLDGSGTNARIDVVNVSGGSGTGYYFTIDGSGNYTTGVGNGPTGISNGTYSIVLYDNDYNSAILDNAVINCTPLTGSVSVSCDDTSGSSGSIDVINVSGGSGAPYHFTINDGIEEYSVGEGNGANDIDDGTYGIVLYDSLDNFTLMVSASLSCYVAPPATNYIINVYECGTCTQIGTGVIAPFGDLGSLTGFYVQLTSGDAGLITGGTSSDTPNYTVTSETTFLDCTSACIS